MLLSFLKQAMENGDLQRVSMGADISLWVSSAYGENPRNFFLAGPSMPPDLSPSLQNMKAWLIN